MCGIAGIIYKGELPNENLHKHFMLCLKHRGPDFQDYVQQPGLLFVHTRLSIIDLNAGANQPFISDDGRYTLTFNGESYNYKELKKELEGKGYVFKTYSDTEVLLTGFMVWKEKVLKRLDGMFAFAIYDNVERRVFAAKDRVGKKPLFYTSTDHFFCFASESDAIANADIIPKHISQAALNSLLAIGYVMAPNTLYENVYQLNGGEYLWVNTDNFEVKTSTYWNVLNYYERKINVTEQEAISNIRRLTEKAVIKRLVADVEVGSFLSGGIDSSIVTALASKHQKDIKAFTAGFSNKAFNESNYAANLCKYLKADHFVCEIPAVDVHTILDIIKQTDGVLADTSLLAINPLSKFAKQYIKVVLSGDGADELLAGYDTYRAFNYRRQLKFMPKFIWQLLKMAGVFMPLNNTAKVSWRYKWDKFWASGPMDDIEAHYSYRQHFTINERIAIMGEEHRQLIHDTDPLLQFKTYYNEAHNLEPVERLLYVDFKTWLHNDIVVKTDRASMAWGLEVRSPFLDHELIEYIASLPSHLKTNKLLGKKILRKAFSDILPSETINRKKSGFNVPLAVSTKGFANEYQFLSYTIYKQLLNG